MDIQRFIETVRLGAHYRGQIAHERLLPPREAAFAEPARPLPEALAAALHTLGIPQLYTHQAASLDALRNGDDVVVVTGTASGKTLCYNLAVFETLLDDPAARALYLFPTKALAQDQLRGIGRFAEALPGAPRLRAACYDGDTPGHQRTKIRKEAGLILSNPDMLHAGILPYHAKWGPFLANLRYVILDEVHTYRGIFGSNVANVLRRLRRICAHYGAAPQFVCSSATIANPAEIAERVTGRRMTLIDNDGSPRGRRRFVLWNPPCLEHSNFERKSANTEAQDLLVQLVNGNIQTIVFTRSRVVAELIYRYTRDELKTWKSKNADRIRPYRGGYLADERRLIERELFNGEALAVVSTNALELGIDIGGLDATLIVGFPGSIASLWQQAGRAGRSSRDSLVILVGYNDPIDQFLMRHPDYLLGRSPEHAVIDPSNPYILYNHLRCAAYEIPLTPADEAVFGPLLREIAELIEESGEARRIDDRTYWSSADFPAGSVSLRTASGETYTILDRTSGKPETIGNIDATSAFETVYPEAIYLHGGESYFVECLDTDAKNAFVKRTQADYFTTPSVATSLRVTEQREAKVIGDTQVCFGEAHVEWQTIGYTRTKFYSGVNIGTFPVDLPPQSFRTAATWLVPPSRALEQLRQQGYKAIDGMVAIRNMVLEVLPMATMCDRRDVSGLVDSRNTGVPTLFFHDRFAGGIGFAEKGYELIEKILKECRQLVEECPCRDGCPSCVGVGRILPEAARDQEQEYTSPVPSKGAARILLTALLAEPEDAAQQA